MIDGKRVVEQARNYLGARYQHQGRSTQGMDCAGLVLRVARDLGLTQWDTRSYGRIPDGERMREMVEHHCTPCVIPAPGRIALMRFETDPQHLAIVADHPQGFSLIHALAACRKVVEHRMDALWASRVLGYYNLPGVA